MQCSVLSILSKRFELDDIQLCGREMSPESTRVHAFRTFENIVRCVNRWSSSDHTGRRMHTFRYPDGGRSRVNHAAVSVDVLWYGCPTEADLSVV